MYIHEKFGNSEQLKQAEQESLMDYERINALREGEQNGAEDAYFFARSENDTPSLRKMFCQGFERGFHKGLKYAAPVRTKDLTVSELGAIIERHYDDEMDLKAMILDGIAADREKNSSRSPALEKDCGGDHHHRYVGSFGHD